MSSNPMMTLVLVIGLTAFASFVLGWVAAEVFRLWRFGLGPLRKRPLVKVWDNPRSRRDVLKKPGSQLAVCMFAAVAAGFLFYFLLLQFSPWPPLLTIRHLISFANCDATRFAGFAPARRGEPGYWQRNDLDGDGTACEPWPVK